MARSQANNRLQASPILEVGGFMLGRYPQTYPSGMPPLNIMGLNRNGLRRRAILS